MVKAITLFVGNKILKLFVRKIVAIVYILYADAVQTEFYISRCGKFILRHNSTILVTIKQ